MARYAEMLCVRCGSVAKPKEVTRGTFALELILWCLLILPGLAYTLYRISSKYTGCPICGEPHMIPLDTPKARAMLSYYKKR